MRIDELGETIRTLRTRLGYTQQDLASALQVSPQAVSKWERGENAPDICLLPALAELLGCTVDALCGADRPRDRVVEATAFFLDLRGFSALAGKLQPAELAIALNAFFYPAAEHIAARDGIVLKYMGDALLAVFLGPGQRERAFEAAFACRDASPRPLGIGIASGPVWMGAIGHPASARPDAIGPAVNVASLLLAWGGRRCRATPGTSFIAADGSAVDPVAAALELGDSEEIEAGGVVRAFEVKEKSHVA